MSLLGIVVIAAWVVLLTTVFNVLFTRRLGTELDNVLRTRAVTAAATVAVAADGRLQVSDAVDDAALDTGLWIYGLGGAGAPRSLERPPGSKRVQDIADALAAAPRGYVDRGDDRLYVLPIDRGTRRVGTVVASAATGPYDRAQDEALFGSAVLGLLLTLGAYPVLRFAAARALRPVASMTDQAAEWSATALTQRFGAHQRYREMQSLARTLDGVLDRLSAIVRHERDLSAELSHELRTPLSRILAEADLALDAPAPGPGGRAPDSALRTPCGRAPDSALRTPLVAIRDSALAMEHILETLFAATRAELQRAPGRCELRDVAVTAAGAARSDRVPVQVEVPDGLAAGVDPTIAHRILLPLLDNAQRYARTQVVVTAHRTPGTVVVDVVDDGPGIAVDDRERVFEPGQRGDEADGHDGAGLGLALSRRLARAAAGDVVVAGPGSRLRVRLPPPRTSAGRLRQLGGTRARAGPRVVP
ncbi:MAG: sensor histidine kinase, partial [Jatrophihabitans sp.]|uniref:sensor histidine kinase n=1 Tax=Jatrophihabitans sp. TaxID=1932789 RepID=UPI003F800320